MTRTGAVQWLVWISMGAILVSCDRVVEKAGQGKERIKAKVSDLKETAKAELKERIDEAFVTCDPYKADTRRNRLRFQEYFDTLDVPDAKNIYCYTDYIGMDYKVMFSFTCDTASLSRIVRKKGLALGPEEWAHTGLRGSWEFEWWKDEELDSLKPFHRGEDQEDRIYLWYDSAAHRVTYQQFSL